MQISLISNVTRDLSWTIAITKLKFIDLLTIIEIAKTTKTIKTKVIIQDFNKLLIETKSIFNLTKTTIIVIIQD